MQGVSFLSLAYSTPSRVVTNEELDGSLGLGRGVIQRLTGIERRRYLAPGESLQSLAVDACRDAVTRSGLDPSEIDSLIFYTDSPPVLPEGAIHRRVYYDISTHIQYLLGEKGIPLACECVCIGGSCVSFLLSAQMAMGLIRSGLKKHVLLVGAACNSLFLEDTDKNVAMTFGDGAAASILGPSADEGIIGIFCMTDGRGYLAGCYPEYRTLFINRKRVAEFAPLAFQAALNGLLARTGLRIEDFDVVIPHQAGIKIIERGMELAGVPRDKVYLCLQEVGNTGAPAVQMALAKAEEDGRLRAGDLVALVAFGTGWNYGAAAFRYRGSPEAGKIPGGGPSD
ncbi:MAG: ketoacyl-ACP synthase III [Candidatus Aminicenantales bacterium]